MGLPWSHQYLVFEGSEGGSCGDWVCCHTTMVQVVGTWARDLNLPVPLVPVCEMGTVIVLPHPTPPGW